MRKNLSPAEEGPRGFNTSSFHLSLLHCQHYRATPHAIFWLCWMERSMRVLDGVETSIEQLKDKCLKASFFCKEFFLLWFLWIVFFGVGCFFTSFLVYAPYSLLYYLFPIEKNYLQPIIHRTFASKFIDENIFLHVILA